MVACRGWMKLLGLVTWSLGLLMSVVASQVFLDLTGLESAAAKDRSHAERAQARRDEAHRADGVTPDIIAGADVPDGTYPFVVALLDLRFSTDPSTQQFCAGTLIAPQYVLTASHCLAAKRLRASNLRVAVGRTVLTSSQGELVEVDRWIRQRGIAVAVVRLAHPIETVQPIPMVAPGDASAETPGTELIVAGWGDTIRRPGGGAPRFPARLNAATVPVRPDRACNKAYRAHAFQPAAEMCAGGTGTDVCFGDSGGPIFDAEAGFRLVGVTIGGYGCGTKVPGIYAQISAPTTAAVIRAFIDDLEAGSGRASAPHSRRRTD